MSEGTAKSSGASRSAQFARPAFKNIIPYMLVVGAPKFIEFLKNAFEGKEELRVPRPDGSIMHAEVRIGDSVIELAEANEQFAARPMTVHLYVEDAGKTYDRALKAGATSVYAMTDKHPSGDRQGGVKDAFGNVWYIAEVTGWTPGPEGVRSVQPFMHLRDANKMIPFAETAFGAETLGVAKSDDGKILHGTIRIGTGTFEIDEAAKDAAPAPCYLHIYVPDADLCYERAVKAGGIGVSKPEDKPYEERSATVQDPFGNVWFVATYTGK